MDDEGSGTRTFISLCLKKSWKVAGPLRKRMRRHPIRTRFSPSSKDIPCSIISHSHVHLVLLSGRSCRLTRCQTGAGTSGIRAALIGHKLGIATLQYPIPTRVFIKTRFVQKRAGKRDLLTWLETGCSEDSTRNVQNRNFPAI